ncbi:hypothetical protein F5148DRAFT_1272948 [Russula earlei]|uniref:Uncharacterized protein n=1 Tax=Russula earlei TaxID=71964 RepID=A0ACC0TR79_9AGAM|nr:hypothetical protein F5148DRAFT_1272948 [Russula earlei]
MQRLILVLFSVIALLGFVIPSFGSAIEHTERETNADRLARGLPPLPPTRRHGPIARQASPSQLFIKPGRNLAAVKSRRTPKTYHIEVRDQENKVLGYIQNNASGSHGLNLAHNGDHIYDLPVQYNPTTKTLLCVGANFEHFVGAHRPPPTMLGAKSTSFSVLANVDLNDPNAEASIWYLNGGQLTAAMWTNLNSNVPVRFFIDVPPKNTIKISGNPSYLKSQGLQEVFFFLVA